MEQFSFIVIPPPTRLHLHRHLGLTGVLKCILSGLQLVLAKSSRAQFSQAKFNRNHGQARGE